MKKTTSGFTIVELLIVIVIIAILAAITVFAFNGVRARAIESEKSFKLTTLQKAIENFRTINGRYPGSTEVQGSAGATLLGLSIKDVEPSDFNSPGSGINCYYGNNSSVTGICYQSRPSADGSGSMCNAPTVCRWYNIAYYSQLKNETISTTNGY